MGQKERSGATRDGIARSLVSAGARTRTRARALRPRTEAASVSRRARAAIVCGPRTGVPRPELAGGGAADLLRIKTTHAASSPPTVCQRCTVQRVRHATQLSPSLRLHRPPAHRLGELRVCKLTACGGAAARAVLRSDQSLRTLRVLHARPCPWPRTRPCPRTRTHTHRGAPQKQIWRSDA